MSWRAVSGSGVLAVAGLLAVCLSSAPQRSTAETLGARPAPGKFLVAARSLRDPNFEQTVVLLVDYGPEGALGVIVNRATAMKLSLLLPQAEAIGGREDVVYEGGPVMPSAMLVLMRSEQELEGAQQVFDDVQATPSRDLLERMIARGLPADRLRVYFGHAGWGPGQLDAEVARGGWLILPGDADTIFDASPSEIWARLIRRESDRLASLAPWAGSSPAIRGF